MKNEKESYFAQPVFIAQAISILLIWLLVTGIAIWIGNLIYLSSDLHDSFGASVGISLVAIPVFITLASILTYVFVGLHKEEKRLYTSNGEEK
jgi:hypothetical protein